MKWFSWQNMIQVSKNKSHRNVCSFRFCCCSSRELVIDTNWKKKLFPRLKLKDECSENSELFKSHDSVFFLLVRHLGRNDSDFYMPFGLTEIYHHNNLSISFLSSLPFFDRAVSSSLHFVLPPPPSFGI